MHLQVEGLAVTCKKGLSQRNGNTGSWSVLEHTEVMATKGMVNRAVITRGSGASKVSMCD